MRSKTITIRNKEKSNFEPTTKTLLRIVKTLSDNGPEAKTSLSVDANLNYTRLARHIVWMEAKGLVELAIDESQIKIGLTDKGKEFATTFSIYQ